MGVTRAISCFMLEIWRENEETKYSKIPAKIRPVLLALHKKIKQSIHKAKETLAIHRRPKRGNWANLAPDLVHLISMKMEDASDIIRFCAVCKGWRFAADVTGAPPQLPWFMWPTVPISKTERHNTSEEYFVYSFSTNTTRRVRFPASHKPYLEGASASFTLFFEYPARPLTLSPFSETTYRIMHPEDLLCYKITRFPYDQNRNLIPMTNRFYYVVTYRTPHETVKINYVGEGPGQEPRDIIKNAIIVFPSGPIVIGHYKGRLFLSLSIPRVTWIYDAATGIKSTVEIPHPNESFKFDALIEVKGDFLALMQFRVEKMTPYGKSVRHRFEMYQLEHTHDFSHCRWSKVPALFGNTILY